MITELLDIIQFGPHEVPFVAPLMSMGALGFIFVLWFVKEIEEDRKQAAKKASKNKTSTKNDLIHSYKQ